MGCALNTQIRHSPSPSHCYARREHNANLRVEFDAFCVEATATLPSRAIFVDMQLQLRHEMVHSWLVTQYKRVASTPKNPTQQL